MKKIVSLLLVVALTAAIAVGGTLAYLTDRDAKTNVFTVGNVDISLDEDFEQGATLIPGVDIEKKPIITNTGNNDAWVWLTFAIPSALDNWALGTQDGSNENVIHWNQLGATTAGYVTDTRVANAIAAGHLDDDLTAAYINDNNMTWNLGGNAAHSYQETINGVSYNVYVMTYNKALEPGETTLPNIYKVFLDATVDIDPNGDWHKVVNGNVTDLDWNSNTDGNPVIYVNAYAVQKEQFATVEDAVAAYKSQWGKLNGAYAEVSLASNADELIEALENGEDVAFISDIKIDPANMSNAYGKTGINVKNGQEIDGNGKTLDIKGAGGTWDSGINTTGGTIKNVTVTGSFRGIFINHNSTHSEPVILENVTIDGTTYTISCDQGTSQTLTATNSTFNGWTSYAATLGSATFVDCTFGEGNGYAFCRPYAPTTFVGCDFEAGFKIDPRAVVTFEDCTIGGVALTSDNLAVLVTSNIDNASVK